MKARWLSVTAATAFCALSLIASQAEAQGMRGGGGGGGVRMGGGFGGGGFRGGVAPGFGGGGFRGGGVLRGGMAPRFAGAGLGGPRIARPGGPLIGARPFAPQRFGYRPHYRRNYGYAAFPFLAGALAAPAWSYAYDDECGWRKVWTHNGWRWRRYCDVDPYAYGY